MTYMHRTALAAVIVGVGAMTGEVVRDPAGVVPLPLVLFTSLALLVFIWKRKGEQ